VVKFLKVYFPVKHRHKGLILAPNA
jgi:hypothetical protein